MDAARFAQLVGGARRTGDELGARCPAHEDRRASLTFRDGERGLLVHCHAGCSAEAIAGALGLRLADLFHDNGGGPPGGRQIVATYDYRDEDGRLLFEVVRYLPKGFKQRRPDGRGGLIWNLEGVRRVLYRLPELLKGPDPVLIPEGERDVDNLRHFGFTATTNPQGAGKWRDEYAEPLRGRAVVLISDNDAAGRQHMDAVARSLTPGAASVRRLALEGLAEKGDVTDWLAQGHAADELRALIAAAPTWDEVHAGARDEAGPEVGSAGGTEGGLALTPLRDLLAEPADERPWVAEGRLPVSGLSILAGKPKSGKSTLARCLSLAVARGAPWLGFATRQGRVFYLGLEEKRGEVRRHFEAMGAASEDPISVFIAPSPQDGLAQLRRSAEDQRPALIIVDPLLKLVRVRDANDYALVTQALEPLLALARETGAHVLAVHHTGKGERSGGDAILGSTAIFAAVDTALLLRRAERYRTLCSVQRYGEDLEEVTLTLNPETRTVTLGAPRREADQAQAESAILDYLGGQTEPLEERPILEAVEGKNAVKVRALRHLVECKSVTRTGAGKKGDPYRYAVSTTLVPTYTRERENENPETAASADEQAENSRSRETAPAGGFAESRERESEALEEAEL